MSDYETWPTGTIDRLTAERDQARAALELAQNRISTSESLWQQDMIRVQGLGKELEITRVRMEQAEAALAKCRAEAENIWHCYRGEAIEAAELRAALAECQAELAAKAKAAEHYERRCAMEKELEGE